MVLLQNIFAQFIPFNDIPNACRIDNSSNFLRTLEIKYTRNVLISMIFQNKIFGSQCKPISQVSAMPAKFTRLLAEPDLLVLQ